MTGAFRVVAMTDKLCDDEAMVDAALDDNGYDYVGPITRNSVLRVVPERYIDECGDALFDKSSSQIESELIEALNAEIAMVNATRPKNNQLRLLNELPNAVVARLVTHLHHVVRVSYSASNMTRGDLAVYVEEGPREGIYSTNEDDIKRLIYEYNYGLDERGVRDVLSRIGADAPVVQVCREPNLIPMANGIFDFSTKQLMPFTPEKVFVTKFATAFNPNASVCPVIHNDKDGTDWTVDEQIAMMSDEPGMEKLLWQVIGAMLRPNVRWNRSLWFYSEQGNNGKGTLCTLIQNLIGSGNYASISIADFAESFKIEDIAHVSAIIAHENSVDKYIEDVAALKAVITNDILLVNRKYKSAVSVEFHGLMIQCVNDMPKVRDKSESWYRRLLIVPFERCFTGHERQYIKDDYIGRKEVLEYVAYKALMADDFREFDIPPACDAILQDYREANDPVREFWADVCKPDVYGEGGVSWSFLPYRFLYDLYVAWFKMTMPSGKCLNSRPFIKRLKAIIEDDTDWEVVASPVRPKMLIGVTEPLIEVYGLSNWMHRDYRGADPKMRCTLDAGDFESSYVGLRRIAGSLPAGDDE